jgi:hypothetical protein
MAGLLFLQTAARHSQIWRTLTEQCAILNTATKPALLEIEGKVFVDQIPARGRA